LVFKLDLIARQYMKPGLSMLEFIVILSFTEFVKACVPEIVNEGTIKAGGVEVGLKVGRGEGDAVGFGDGRCLSTVGDDDVGSGVGVDVGTRRITFLTDSEN
jgi:hypothetical protein